MNRPTIATLTLTLVLAACGDGAGAESTTTTQPTTTTSTTSTTTTTSLAPTTTTAPTTATTEPTPERVMLALLLTFEDFRDTYLDAISGVGTVQSVDRFEMSAADENDPLSVRLVVDITSEYRTDEYIHDQGWELTRTLAILWKDDNLFGSWGDTWAPDFSLIISGRSYECPDEFMLSLADARASRAEWEETCA